MFSIFLVIYFRILLFCEKDLKKYFQDVHEVNPFVLSSAITHILVRILSRREVLSFFHSVYDIFYLTNCLLCL